MDYEWKIKRIEEEARHEKAMRELQSSRMDAHDNSISAIQVILERTERNIEALTITRTATEQKLQTLTAREHTNGKH
jgi:hypothetical protein